METKPANRMTPRERDLERQAQRFLEQIGHYESIERWIRKISKASTRANYLFMIRHYFGWLRAKKGVLLDPDQLVQDNLICVYESKAVDTKTKRRHTDWLDEYVNTHLLKMGLTSTRTSTSAAVRTFYRRNDSPLFGDFSLSEQPVKEPTKPLSAEDVRTVLKALPLMTRTPLLMLWQSGIEINRILALRWGNVSKIWEGEYPLKVEFYGRKKHRRPYHTYLGQNSIDHLKLIREEWKRLRRADPSEEDLIFPGKRGTGLEYDHLGKQMARTAVALAKAGKVKNSDPRSWHTHALRHSFETEGAHAGVKAEFRDFFEGHLRGIQWVYNHRDELHPEDLILEYRKLEPYVSLEPGELQIRQEMESDFLTRMREKDLQLEETRKQVDELLRWRQTVEAAMSKSSDGRTVIRKTSRVNA